MDIDRENEQFILSRDEQLLILRSGHERFDFSEAPELLGRAERSRNVLMNTDTTRYVSGPQRLDAEQQIRKRIVCVNHMIDQVVEYLPPTAAGAEQWLIDNT